MVTTNLFVIANVNNCKRRQFRILLPFFPTSWDVGVLNTAVFNSFHNRVEFGTTLEGLRNVLGLKSQPPLGTPLTRSGRVKSSGIPRHVGW